MLLGFQTGITGLLADLIGHNRRLIEESLLRIRRVELGEFGKLDNAMADSAKNLNKEQDGGVNASEEQLGGGREAGEIP